MCKINNGLSQKNASFPNYIFHLVNPLHVHMGVVTRKIVLYADKKDADGRPACTSVQSDQSVCYLLSDYHMTLNCFELNCIGPIIAVGRILNTNTILYMPLSVN